MGEYPAALPTTEDKFIIGELYKIKNEDEFGWAMGQLDDYEGVVVEDDPQQQLYPMPMNAHERDEVFVGRLRRDETQPNTLNMWFVSDNLRKGAATNAVQIAEELLA